MARQWARLVWWLGQGQNAAAMQVVVAIVLLAVTAWYAYITRRMLKESEAQIREQVRPKLRFGLKHIGDLTAGELLIENTGDFAAQFLDVTLRCYVGLNGPTLPLYLSQYRGVVIEAGDKLPIAFDFRPQLFKLPGIELEEMTYRYFIVASDRSERIFHTYKYNPIINKMIIGHHRPLRVIWQQRPSVWRPYMRLKEWLKW